MNELDKYTPRPEQSAELLKELHILTRDGKLNQDSRRKLKQIYHLYQFILPLLEDIVRENNHTPILVDHGAGKSYLGFILYDLFYKSLNITEPKVYGIELRKELVLKSMTLAQKLKFSGMYFLHLSVEESITSDKLPDQIDIVTALHACDTATDDAITFALKRQAKYIVLVPCCQAEIAKELKSIKASSLTNQYLYELWHHPIQAREFGAHLTNVLRILQLETHGYTVTVTELVGFEHSMKNELIIAKFTGKANLISQLRLTEILENFALGNLKSKFLTAIATS